VRCVDDWAATGALVQAAHALVELCAAIWLGAAVLVDGAELAHVRRKVNLRSLLHIRELKTTGCSRDRVMPAAFAHRASVRRETGPAAPGSRRREKL